MKARLKQYIIDELMERDNKWISFRSIYGVGSQVYSKMFLEEFDVEKTKTNANGIYDIIAPTILCMCQVYLDHIDFIQDKTFKEDISKILEA